VFITYKLQKKERMSTRIAILLFLSIALSTLTVFTENYAFTQILLWLSIFLALALCLNLYRISLTFHHQNIVFDALLHTTPNGVVSYILDDNLTILYANEGFYEIIGYTPEEVRSTFNSSGLAFAGAHELFETISLANTDDNPINFSLEFSLIKKDGSTVWINASCYRRNKYHNKNTISYFMSDITKQKLQEQKYNEEKTQQTITNELTNDIIFEYDIATDTMVHSKSSSTSKFNPPVIKNYSSFIKTPGYLEADSKEAVFSAFRQVVQGQCIHQLEFQALTDTNTYSWVCLNSKTLCNEFGQPLKIIGKFNNIDVQKKAIVQLQNKAYHDPLTNLYNKGITESLINQSLMTLSLLAEEHFALMVIDLDDFKNINDSFGHLVGDEVLQSVASQLNQHFPSESIIGRIGGDEFVVFLKHLSTPAEVFKQAQIISDSISKLKPSQKDYLISASIGIALAPQNGLTYKDLFKSADDALYSTKNNGKNHFVIAPQKCSAAT
jgi:diguanylate cyclase (GGDEF)-like protein/PAS domain S-box-containing protein